MIDRDQLPKGPATEERLRNYFLGVGYFVLRGAKFKYNDFDVTDIDLWLYGLNSPLSRERVNVDIKDKKTPQALERIFWAKGLQDVLGLDACVVATTDARPDVREFGLKHDVRVLDGHFVSRLKRSEKSQLQRLTEEEFVRFIDDSSLGKLGGDWRGRYEQSKSRVLDSLDFDGCNAWLMDIEYFLKEASSMGLKDPSAWRLAYISCSLFLISLDFLLRDHVTLEQDERRAVLENGFRYGKAGRTFVEKIGKVAAGLVASVASQPGLRETLERELATQAGDLRADVLADFFSRNVAQTALFDAAREFEAGAFALEFYSPSRLSAGAQSVLGVLCDFFGLDRKRVLV
ncbi:MULTISPECIES: hypothetical protein [Burkholderia]|uniref:Uncharacterized protein n=3 Tax=Pseudomonadota TaxID=1224 RepID=Q63WY7_BURPS|nr:MULTISPECIES: hypothetical protein [Burkholderia]AJX28377.1 hypothetical protein AQ15_707 [Burkholderia pseudomallei K96243]MDE3327278.1 hypothetical protein [Burkholderia pseudomallei]RFS56078.1 hypothetical protein D0U05_13815 [Burkholderia pseudomallei]RFS62033.1 hypothetical protein D0U02_15150 [Burkholderia pseudomallei]RFS70116.1 hypothetical protein D0U01_05980 [Burkholderia pseudomallei]